MLFDMGQCLWFLPYQQAFFWDCSLPTCSIVRINGLLMGDKKQTCECPSRREAVGVTSTSSPQIRLRIEVEGYLSDAHGVFPIWQPPDLSVLCVPLSIIATHPLAFFHPLITYLYVFWAFCTVMHRQHPWFMAGYYSKNVHWSEKLRQYVIVTTSERNIKDNN